GAPRPGSARHRAAVRRRRVTLGVAGVLVAAAVGVGAWYASADGEDQAPQDTHSTSAP
ncbi:serine/threonine protein kinase, partial [Streptomyces sp. UMAF16]|nr:serine/threonine protein kinase [Streptomyces sp. UMAF16]